MENIALSIEKSYWVIPGRFRAGEYPGSINEQEARGKLRWLLDLGIDYFIDLTEAGEYDLKPYVPLLTEEAMKLDRSVVHKRIPLRDLSTPTVDEMVNILDTIETSLLEGKSIYLHCFGGTGRTGTVVGCYLASQGLPGVKALEQIQVLRKDLPNAAKASPETEGQRRMVKEWTKGR